MKLVGERRAVAAIVFAFYFIMFLMNAAMGPAPSAPLLYGLAGVYGLAFFSLVAGYFWARWFAVGVGLFGVILGILGFWQAHKDPDHVEVWQVWMQFLMHATATIALWGEAMSTIYDGKTAWREKLHMDENAVQRLGKSVIRAGVSLPIVLAYALAPKQPASMFVGLAALALGGLGLRGLIKMRTWGVLALGVSGVAVAALGLEHTDLYGTIGGVLLVSAAVPFGAAISTSLFGRRLIRA